MAFPQNRNRSQNLLSVYLRIRSKQFQLGVLTPKCKEDTQEDKAISLKTGEMICSGLSWGSSEAVLLEDDINDS